MKYKLSLLLLLGANTVLPVHAQTTPSTALLILNKRDNALAIIDPKTQAVVGSVSAGPDPHEVVASSDGKFAYISNYGGGGSGLHTLSVVDLINQKALPSVDLGPLHSAHGLWFAGGKVYFTAETNKVIGSYDPSSHQVDWVLGVGQDRTHMLVVSKDRKTIFTSNVNSDTISIITRTAMRNGPPPVGPGGGPGGGSDWTITSVHVGKGPEGFDVSPDEKEVWAANSHDGSVSIIDVANKKVTATLDAHINFANRVKFTQDGKYVLITSLGGGDLAIYEAAKRKEIKRLKMGRGAAGILMKPGGSTAYVACSPDDSVAVLDLKTLTVIGHIKSGREPDGLAWAIRP